MKPYYQEIIDLRQEDDRRVLRLLEEAARVLEQPFTTKNKVRASIRALVEIKAKEFQFLLNEDISIDEVSDAFLYNLMHQLIINDFLDESLSVYDWWHKQTDLPSLRSKWTDRRDAWSAIVEIELSEKYQLKSRHLDGRFTTHYRTLAGVLHIYAESTKEKSDYTVDQSGNFPDPTPLDYFLIRLPDLVKELFTGLQAIIQILLEKVIAEVIRGKGLERLRRLKKINDNLSLILLKYNDETGILDKSLVTVKFKNRLHGGYYLDAFSWGRVKVPSVRYTHYNSDGNGSADGRTISVGDAFEQRLAQINYIEYLFGYAQDENGKPISESVQLAKWMKKVGKDYSIHDNDSWVRILTALFQKYKEDIEKGQPQNALTDEVARKAFIASIEHFFKYLDIFTQHTKFNIRDDLRKKEKNYFDTVFPRSITGLYLHDCGVYAVRIAYVIQRLSQQIDRLYAPSKSLARKLYFVSLPFHTGLVVELSLGSIIITHNKDRTLFDQVEVSNLKKRWTSTDIAGNEKSGPPNLLDEEAFKAELSAPRFIHRVDHPAKLILIPKPALAPAHTQKQIWYTYINKVTKSEGRLFSELIALPNQPTYQFPMQYLELLEETRVWYNKHIIRGFWNQTALKAWQTHGSVLDKLLSKLKTDKSEEALIDYKKELINFIDKVVEGLIVVEEADKEFEEKRRKIIGILDSSPRVLDKRAIRTYHLRLSIVDIYLKEVTDYMAALAKHPETLKEFTVPPFATRRSERPS